MIARIWRGTTTGAKGEDYFNYLMETGVGEYRSTQGNLGVYVLRRKIQGKSEFLLISLWDSLDAIRRFAGEDIERPVYYPQDDEFLLERAPTVDHYEVLEGPGAES